MSELILDGTRLSLVRGDITEQAVDAIVNAANPSLLGGGGVDGAIHRRGGPAILRACLRLRDERYPDGLPRGSAVATPAGGLPARGVIHTVGPIWAGGGAGERSVLASAYRSSLGVAVENEWRSVAFPSISTGVYGYPTGQAAGVALETLRSEIAARPGWFTEVRVVLFSPEDLATYRGVLTGLQPRGRPGRSSPGADPEVPTRS